MGFGWSMYSKPDIDLNVMGWVCRCEDLSGDRFLGFSGVGLSVGWFVWG